MSLKLLSTFPRELNRVSTTLDNTACDHIFTEYQTVFDHGTVYKRPVKSLLFMSKQFNIKTELAF